MRLDQIFPGVAELRPDDVQRYLRGRGWHPVDDPRATVAAYANARGDEVVVPLDRALGDYARRLGELVDAVSQSERRPPGEVLEELSLPPGDVLSFRVRSDLVSSGTIPVLDSLRLREGQKNLLLSAAHSALVPQRYFPRLARAEPTELLAQCREGQTARGSYVATILVPVVPAVGELPLEEPYGRRVTRLLMETLQAIHLRLARADDAGLLDDPPPGLSFNLLAALADMRPQGERSTLEVAARWSLGRPPPEAPARVSFDEPQFATMRAVAAALRERTPTTCEVEGYIVRLSRAEPRADAPGEVVITMTLGERSGDARVRVTLPPTVYNERALPAHQSGRRVRVTGVLHQQGRLWRLTDPTGFEALPSDEE